MLLNYSTSISAEKTTTEIMQILVKHGAKAVLINYDGDGLIESLSFKVVTVTGEIAIRLPVNPGAVLKVMKRQGVAGRFCVYDQATRVAWRIAKVWIQAQMAIVETEMVKVEQVFLPYWVMPSGETLYDYYVGTGFQITQGGK